ncbi:MAG: VWA domain-containing protein [Acidobacteriota bacterium]
MNGATESDQESAPRPLWLPLRWRPAGRELEGPSGAGLLGGFTVLLVLLSALAGSSARAQAASPPTVSVIRPSLFEAAVGEQEIEAAIESEDEVIRVVFWVDGQVVGELAEPPWVFRADFGDEAVRHEVEVVAYTASGLTATGFSSTPGIEINESVSIALQQLYVTVTREGARVPGLETEDFRVVDEGLRREIVTFARGDIPFAALVMVDASTSMSGGKLESALVGAKAFFDGMRPLDEGRLTVFSDRVLHSTPFTTFPRVLATGLDSVAARGGTAINDHLYLALRQLEERQGRRVVLLLSDGVDTHSVLSMAQVSRGARRSQALVYWLRLPYRDGMVGGPPALTTAWRNPEGYRREYAALERAVHESGGRIVELASQQDIAPAFRGILEELREQYVLGFYPQGTPQDGRWRSVAVEVEGPGLEVRSRGGYVDR